MMLLAGVGYQYLSDLSFGPLLVERMRGLDWPETVEVEDLSYGPIGVVMHLEDQPGRYDCAIFAGAVERGRAPGTLQTYRWEITPREEEVQARVAEAVTGVIGLENLLIILHHFGVMPAQTWVVELEPVERECGLEMSPLGQKRAEEALRWIRGQADVYAHLSGNGYRVVSGER